LCGFLVGVGFILIQVSLIVFLWFVCYVMSYIVTSLLSRVFCSKGVELCWFFVWKKFFSSLVLYKAFGAFFDPILLHIFFGLHIQVSLLVFRST
jgi:hypothetical protein